MSNRNPARRDVESDYFRSLLWAILSSLFLFALADANPIFGVLSIASALAAWSLSVRPAAPISRSAINVTLVLVIGLAIVVTVGSGIGVSSFAIFAAMLLIVKLFDLRSPRDHSQVLILLIAMLIAAVLTSNSMITGVTMLIAGFLLLRAVLRFHIFSAVYESDPSALSTSVRKQSSIDLRSFQVATLFFGALLGTIVFLIMPRNLGNSSFGDWGGQTQTVTGFNDEVELGRPGLISQSSTPVLDLQVFDRNGKNIGQSESPAIYLRGAVLDTYEDGLWTYKKGRHGSILGIHRLPAETTVRPAINRAQHPWSREYRISLRGSILRESPVFVPWLPVEFRSPQSIRFGYDRGNGLMLHEGTTNLNYRVRTINPELTDPPYPDDYSRGEISPSGITDQIRSYAREVLQNAGIDPDPQTRPFTDDHAALRLLESHLQSRFTYTLNSEPVPNGQDATEWFLFERKRGHCEYYASALALLARSVGIDARVITGYVASDFNEVTGQYIIRESNAHAWVEAEVGPDKWIVFDGTPRADFQQIHERKPGLFHSLTRLYETIEYAWVKGVVGYDSESRRQIFGDISPDFGLLKFGYKLRERVGRSRGKLLGLAFGISAIVFGVSFMLGLAVLRFRTILARLLAPFSAILTVLLGLLGISRRTAQEREFDKLERAIARALALSEVQRDHSTPLWTFLKRSDDRLIPRMRAPLADAARLLYRLQFAPPKDAPSSGEIAQAIAGIHASENR